MGTIGGLAGSGGEEVRSGLKGVLKGGSEEECDVVGSAALLDLPLRYGVEAREDVADGCCHLRREPEQRGKGDIGWNGGRSSPARYSVWLSLLP